MFISGDNPFFLDQQRDCLCNKGRMRSENLFTQSYSGIEMIHKKRYNSHS